MIPHDLTHASFTGVFTWQLERSSSCIVRITENLGRWTELIAPT